MDDVPNRLLFNDPNYIVPNYSQVIVDNMKTLNILDLMNVRCWCKLLNNTIVAYVSTLDIARGAGLIKTEVDYRRVLASPLEGGQQYLEYNRIRWDRLEQYYFEVVEEMRLNNDPMIRFLMPFNREWLLLEAALGIVNKCNSTTAKKFRNQAMRYIADYVKNINYKFQTDIIYCQQQQIKEYKEKLESAETERALLLSIIHELDPD